MPYLASTDLHGLLPPAFVAEALDDDRDGSADSGVWDAVEEDAAGQIDSRLGGRYSVPFTAPLPAVVVEAAKVFACELLYQRRGMSGEANPWTARANAMRKRLEAIGDGSQPLTPTTTKVRPPVSVISTPAVTVPAGRLNG